MFYDASSNGTGPSLNDCLYPGPALCESLFCVLLRFQIIHLRYREAFQQILPPPHDKDFVRLIWFKDLHELNVNNIETVEYQIHRLCRALFGVSSRPFLLTLTLTYHMTTFSLCIKF